MVTTTDDDEKKWKVVKSIVRLDEGGSYKGSLRLWMRDGEVVSYTEEDDMDT